MNVNERTQEISELMKLHIQGVWQNAHKFIRQLAHTFLNLKTTPSPWLHPPAAKNAIVAYVG